MFPHFGRLEPHAKPFSNEPAQNVGVHLCPLLWPNEKALIPLRIDAAHGGSGPSPGKRW